MYIYIYKIYINDVHACVYCKPLPASLDFMPNNISLCFLLLLSLIES